MLSHSTTYLRPQAVKVANILESKGSLSAAQAARRGIVNLAARICELRDQGFQIDTVKRPRNRGYRYELTA